ncbi:alpha/beta hydrolase [Mycolicibacterium vaccae]|nr:alpha/beta hydrolase [Mycolicibacterium vaccae]
MPARRKDNHEQPTPPPRRHRHRGGGRPRDPGARRRGTRPTGRGAQRRAGARRLRRRVGLARGLRRTDHPRLPGDHRPEPAHLAGRRCRRDQTRAGRQDGPTLLVGHSWGGTVITEVGVDPKVAGLVYVSGLAPDAGETTGQQYADYPAPPNFVIETQPDGFGFLNAEKFKAGFAADTSDEEAAFLRDSQVPVRMAAFEETLTQAAWRTKPSWAVIATQDEAIDPRMLRQTAQRIGAEITEVEASHVLFLTHPRAVADVIDRAAKESGQL